MVKQGHYAKVSRQKQLRQLKQRHQVHADRVIEPTAVAEFLQVRYHLTRGTTQRPIVRKTMQHFAVQWLTFAQQTATNTWDFTALTQQTLQQFNRQLPWQGYAVINQAFLDFQTVMLKEVPAVPLKQRLLVSAPLTPTTWTTVLTTQLTVNSLLGMLGDNLSQVTTAQIEQLRQELITADGTIDWQKVASLLTPVTLPVTDQTAATQTWFTQLGQLTVNDFDQSFN